MIRTLVADDWPEVKRIYKQGLATKNATFETTVPSFTEWDRMHLPICRFAYEEQTGAIAGWIALSPVSSRFVYSGVAEISVYVSKNAQGQGIGTALLEHLIPESEKEGIWTLEAGVFPENKSSLEIHKKAGFRIVGTREKIGQLDGEWRDVVLLERRSKNL